jgi:YhcH/YjgK/YiaL family protein
MMILDRLENAALYRPLGARITLALDYLGRTDFSRIPEGRYELDGDRVYAVVQRYRPKPLAEARWEAHRQYIDVQFMAEGVERIGYAPLDEALPVERAYDSQKDVVFFVAQGDFLTVRAGDFAIFYPTDVHAPCLASQTPAPIDVCKVVVKCRVE